MRNPALRKLISLTLALAYLFLGAGGASALIACYEPEGYSHVEYNPAGQCYSKCDISTTLSNGSIPTLSLEDGAISTCQDVSLSQELAHSSHKFFYNLPVLSLSATATPYFSPAHQIPVHLLHAPQPPPQTLAALRTIVLII